MPTTRRLSRKEVTYSDVKGRESNVLHELTIWDERQKFILRLGQNQSTIKTIVAHHLGVRPGNCSVSAVEDWIWGTFNICISVAIVAKDEKEDADARPFKRVMARFANPHRVGESFRPGNVDEKIRCEAAAYAWLHRHCPSVPIPRLYGFGLSTGQQFSALENLPLFRRLLESLRRRMLTWLGFPVPSRFARHQNDANSAPLGSGYLVIEYIEKSQAMMLSETWAQKRNDPQMRQNLFQGLSRILLAVTRVQLPRIGSFVLDDAGLLQLVNRPLTPEIHQMEGNGIPVDIPRHLTYTSVDSYVVDLLSLHDARMREQPNSISSDQDGLFNMSALTAMRATFPLFFRRDLRHGPFVLNLPDLHQSNVLVDDSWNIKYLIDLEWVCSLPIEMTLPPRCLADRTLDDVDEKEYEPMYREFMRVLEQVEKRQNDLSTPPGQLPLLSSIMNQAWQTGTFWYTVALRNPFRAPYYFYDHIQPKLTPYHKEDSQFYKITVRYWAFKSWKIIQRKIKESKEYDARLREAFEVDQEEGEEGRKKRESPQAPDPITEALSIGQVSN